MEFSNVSPAISGGHSAVVGLYLVWFWFRSGFVEYLRGTFLQPFACQFLSLDCVAVAVSKDHESSAS